MSVSISQSRYFSFQGLLARCFRSRGPAICFNLAIEILLFSRFTAYPIPEKSIPCFNLAIEILLFSRAIPLIIGVAASLVSISQSRYFSFQVYHASHSATAYQCVFSFNLAIEILLFSSSIYRCSVPIPCASRMFQSRNRDTSLFKLWFLVCLTNVPFSVSISQSRYFSFQGNRRPSAASAAICVSISQSRYFSFQVSDEQPENRTDTIYTKCFNLAIEILLFSSAFCRAVGESPSMFQSRNRDTSLFKLEGCT